MLKSLATWCFAASVLLASTCAIAEITIIPEPQHLQAGEGSYSLDANTGIDAPNDSRAREISSFLRDAVLEQTGIHLATGPHAHGIELAIDPSVKGEEAYRLSVTTRGVIIQASTDKGLFWGVQTLRQLLPLQHGSPALIPVVQIDDAPAFAYRGFMLDVGRHFYPVSFIKKQIDLLSYYKINVFHWHLTEDQGWRLQIKRYPKLTSVGGWRTEADGSRYGGFYTQAQARDVVEYARKRNITVIPEIEMPGHSVAALASYPELSCTKEPVHVATTWGVFKDIDCVGKPETFTFLEHVLDEVMTVFPSPYIHIGGDETPKDRWKDCDTCQALMHQQGLKDEEGLQSYFIKKIQAYLASKGKTLVGWDEILEGGADKNAIIEIWRGDDEARKALANGNRIIVAGPFYLDSPSERLTVKSIYQTDFAGAGNDPVFAEHRAQILGAEAPLWSERANPYNAESKIYPRMLAFAERLWSDQDRDDAAYASFEHRLQAQYPWLDEQQVAYGAEDRPVVQYTIAVNAQHDGWQLQAKRGFDDVQNHYTTDGSEPSAQSPSFGDAVDIKQPGTLKVIPFRHGLRYDNATSFMLVNSEAMGHPIQLSQDASSDYAPASSLVDGVLGSSDFHDGRWVGWNDNDVDAIIDLQQDTSFHTIKMNFLSAPQSRIVFPQQMTFSTSLDGVHWTKVYGVTPEVDVTSPSRIQTIEFKSDKPITARCIRIEAQRPSNLPAPFPGGAKNIWLFADEVLVQ
ncbi:glycoside hydrolase family 20 protein [Dyella mobilis]|uniref:beta-N-acetylhexosaminidase n=1 Tax=Dyella mobilis TaxID=1849582 RepID=A0ABS2KIZ0_9GAMM|nr:family 20 glycosylhydrolase [Dyella mobilis]MBM7131148.1 family 20 glycosylhydrolase [Dyella mobilis]GLQ98918.1 beta-N-acetylhexosaminidase [Dyella mobilis]